MPTRTLRDTLVTALAPLAWGTTHLVTTEWLPPGRPLFVAAMRALPVGLLLMLWTQRLPSGAWWWRSAVLGTLNIGVFFALLFVAAYRLPGGVAATMGALQPFVVAALAWPVLGDRPTRRTFISAAAGAMGVGLLVLGPAARLDALGLAAAVGSTLTMAGGTVLTKRWGRPVPLLAFTAWQLVTGGLLLVLLALVVEGWHPHLTFQNAGGFLYLGLVNTGLAYALWFRGIERLRVGAITGLALLSPVVATVVGLLALQQTLNLMQWGGMLLVLGSVVMAQRSSRRAEPSTAHLHSDRAGGTRGTVPSTSR